MVLGVLLGAAPPAMVALAAEHTAPSESDPTDPTDPTVPTVDEASVEPVAAPGVPSEPSAQAEPTSPLDESTLDESTLDESTLDESTLDGPTLEDGVLPCGLRVLIAQDQSLPVAAVILALDTGTEDDPTAQPGLVHALAYHLLQGNRELPPAGAAAMVHDRGGITSLAIGPAQVRYESLVPLSTLSDVIWAEAERLRAPTVSEALWTSTVRWARRDVPLPWRIPRAAVAAAHGVPSLEPEGRGVTESITSMVPRAVGRALADRFDYTIATLVVVSPHPPAELRERIEARFADLPPTPRHVRERTPRWRTGTTPQAHALIGQKGNRFVWPVAPEPASIDRAAVLCNTINRQRRSSNEPARGRLRCYLELDPRRPTLLMRATGVEDPLALVRARLDRIARHEEDALVESERERLRRRRAQDLRSPLPLARQLSATGRRPDDAPGWRTRPISALTGEAELSSSWVNRAFGPHLGSGAAIRLVAPEASR